MKKILRSVVEMDMCRRKKGGVWGFLGVSGGGDWIDGTRSRRRVTMCNLIRI